MNYKWETKRDELIKSVVLRPSAVASAPLFDEIGHAPARLQRRRRLSKNRAAFVATARALLSRALEIAHQSRELLKIERAAAVDVDASEEFSGRGFGVAPAHDDGERADDLVELHLTATVGVERVEEFAQLRSFAIAEGGLLELSSAKHPRRGGRLEFAKTKRLESLFVARVATTELVDRAKVFAQSARDFNDARRVRLYQGVGRAICGRHCRVRGQRLARYFWTGHRKNDASVRSVGLFARGHA